MRHAWMEGRRDQSGGGPPVLAQERDVQRRPTPLVPFFVGPAAIFAVLLGLVFVPWGRLRRRQRSAPVEPIDPPAPIWLVRLSVGFDWTARPALQQELDALSRFLDVDTDAARALSAARLLALLHAHVSSACYACAHAEALDAQRGPPRLEALALDLRARFRHETRGARASGPSTVQARPEEGPGMLVVSVVLAMRRGVALPAVVDRASLAAALRLPLGPELPALEVVWSPAESNDRMSSYELERLYHELARLSDATHVGGARCGFCGTPRATEVPRCVRCGAAA